MDKILIIYYSGVINTKKVAYLFYDNIKNDCIASIFSIENIPLDFNFDNYDSIILGFPTIHSSPASLMNKFILSKKCHIKKTVFLFTTCGLYSANSLRIFGKQCLNNNLIPIMNKSYRCCATDGILLAPFMNYWFEDEKNLVAKIKYDSSEFLKINKNDFQVKMMPLKWYTIINYPNKFLGQHLKATIYFIKNKCIKCNICVSNCPTQAIYNDNDFIKIDQNKCVSCYRCIHNCPNMALSLFKNHSHKITIGYNNKSN